MKEITEDEIYEKLTNHSGYARGREFIKNERKDSYKTVGSIVYSLNGSPPKGYAIVIPDFRTVNFYDNEGKRFMIMDETRVHELTDHY